MKELKDALKKAKTRKAPGLDGITGEMLKYIRACSRAVLLKIFNHNWMKGVAPAVWKEAVVRPVPKKGKDKNPRSYRPISLVSCVGEHGESASLQPPGGQQCYLQHRIHVVSTHRELTCPEHRRRIPGGGKKGFGSFLRSFQCIWQGLERGTSRKTTENWCALQDIHVDPALRKDCPIET